jgi:hypothetical protein
MFQRKIEGSKFATEHGSSYQFNKISKWAKIPLSLCPLSSLHHSLNPSLCPRVTEVRICPLLEDVIETHSGGGVQSLAEDSGGDAREQCCHAFLLDQTDTDGK